MANSKIILTFNADLTFNQQIGYSLGIPTFQSLIHEFIWKAVRSISGQVTIGTPTSITGERSAINFVTALNLDFNYNGSNFIISRVANVVTIETKFSNIEFSTFICVDDGTAYPWDLSSVVTAEIINNTEPIFEIDSVTFSAASLNSCQNVKASITTTNLATKINQPINVPVNTNNPIVVDVLRNSFFNFDVENSSGQVIQMSFITPPLLNILLFGITINNSPAGATVIVNNTINEGFSINEQLTFQYSLDNSSWQNSNEFNGLIAGDYTLYIKDNLGCSVNKNFNIEESGIQSPYFYISKSNSFRFANRIAWGDSENYKNDDNTLSCEVDVELPYKEFQQFQSADIITTQFKSNYSSNVASILKEDGTIVNIPIVQKTNNIGVKDKRDARRYRINHSKNGIYFLSGNVYNFDTNAVAEPYSLNGLLPEWAQVGNYFSIGTSFYLIEDIVFDEAKNADVIVFTSALFLPGESNIIVGSIYNRFNYEVYEFAIDMVNYINQKFKVRLVNSKINLPTITHLSEVIWCKVKHENVIEIRYRNTTNTDILYSTGIEHKIRIPYLKISGKADEQSEVHKTDTDAILLSADLYEVEDFQFQPVTKEIWRKMMIALSHEKVLLNGVGYVKNGNFNTEGPLERSNLYVLTATMIKTGSVYNSQTSGNIDFDGSAVEVPGLISTESGYVKY